MLLCVKMVQRLLPRRVSTPWSDGTQLVRMPSHMNSTAPLRAAVRERLEYFGYSTGDIFAVCLALDEALVNAIKHGNGHDPNKHVSIRFRIDEYRAWLHVQDEGEGFDPAEVPDPTLPENLERPSGRGVFLMQNYMDILHYNDAGNAVFLCKYRSFDD